MTWVVKEFIAVREEMPVQVDLTVVFKEIGKEVGIAPSPSKDEVQKDARNVPDIYIRKWWKPKTSVSDGVRKVFEEMKKNYENI